MAISRLKTWIAAERLNAADLNGEINNIINNPVDLWSPAAKAADMNGFELIMDADADSSLTADTDDRLDVRLNAVDLFYWDGTTSTLANLHMRGTAGGYNNRISDVNGNEILELQGVASAVNQLAVLNAIAGAEPQLVARGDDTDIDVTITPKGAGTVALGVGVSGAAVATQAQMETATSTSLIVTPGRTQYHPGVAKAWAMADNAGGINASYNVASVTDSGVGQIVFNWSTAFSSGSYGVVACCRHASAARITQVDSLATSSVTVETWDDVGVLADPNNNFYVAAFGDQ